jgi:hypothetical protein
MESLRDEANEYADMFGLTTADAAFYALFKSIIKEAPLGPKSEPFVLRHEQVVTALQQESTWPGFFTIKDLEKAVVSGLLHYFALAFFSFLYSFYLYFLER